MGYLQLKPSLQKNNSTTIWTIASVGDKEVHTFFKCIELAQ